MELSLNSILEIWRNGGYVMIGLALLSVLIYSTGFQLILYILNTGVSRKDQGLWASWVENSASGSGKVGEIIRYTQDRVDSSKQVRNRFEEVKLAMSGMLDRRITYLSTLVAVAPLMGLLGTVMGMLQTFFGIANSGGADTAGVVAAGISEALITTQTGLTIALPGLFIAMIVRRQMHALEASLAQIESLTLTHLKFD